MTKTTALVLAEEPSLQLEKPGFMRRGYWRALNTVGVDTRESQDSFFAGKYQRALVTYKEALQGFKGTVDELKKSYGALRATVQDSEKDIRGFELRLAQPVTLDTRLLGYATHATEPVPRTFSSDEELTQFMNSLRQDLEDLVGEDPDSFSKTYGAPLEAYIRAGEHALAHMEDAVLERTEASQLLQQKRQTIALLRKRRDTIFRSYLDAKTRCIALEGMYTLMEIDGQARALIIQAAAQSSQLEVGADLLLELYDRLAPAEAEARATLSTSMEQCALLEENMTNTDAVTAELVGLE